MNEPQRSLKVRQDPSAATLGRLLAIHDEREKQEAKYPGTTCASNEMSETDKVAILVAEVGEVTEEAKMLRWPHTRVGRGHAGDGDADVRERLRKELVQVGAIVLAWIEGIDAMEDWHDA